MNKEAVVIENLAEGEDTVPSVIGLNERGKVWVGSKAKQNLPVAPDNTVIEVKREMGELLTAELERKYGREPAPAGARADGQEAPVKIKFAHQWMLPQELSAFTLMKMKEIAQREAGVDEICDAVITVPAYFTEQQKRATEEAALLAGLYPRQLIPEPTAAAICYGVDTDEAEKNVYLVYDLGGGTFDVSVIVVEGREITVKATSGDRRLGGGDFDDAIVRWFVHEGRTLKPDWQPDAASLAIIKSHAELAKISLSTAPQTTMAVGELGPAGPGALTLTRETFEALIGELIERSLHKVEESVNAAEANGAPRDSITAILLVGGSSKIPLVQRKLQEHFERDESFIRSDADPDLVVARGAAFLAHRFQPTAPPFDMKKRGDLKLNPEAALMDVTVNLIAEHTLGVGVGVSGGRTEVHHIIPRGTTIPVTRRNPESYTNPDYGTNLQAKIYQGESKNPKENTQIGTVYIQEIPPAPAGAHHFNVEFSLSESGLLSVKVVHIETGTESSAQFEHKSGIGQADSLEIRRLALLEMYAGTIEGTKVADPAGKTPWEQATGVTSKATPWTPHPPSPAGAERLGGAPPTPSWPPSGEYVPPPPPGAPQPSAGGPATAPQPTPTGQPGAPGAAPPGPAPFTPTGPDPGAPSAPPWAQQPPAGPPGPQAGSPPWVPQPPAGPPGPQPWVPQPPAGPPQPVDGEQPP
ncbi:MAG: Hsp70 family protein, partial [Pseudomonadota bacterium]